MPVRSKKIVLVDDDPALLRLLSLRLSAAGYDVVTAENGEKALAQLAVSLPHLVITDLRMDGMDGMTLFDTIHRSHPALPVIILTAHGSIPKRWPPPAGGVLGFSPSRLMARTCWRMWNKPCG